jgi:hypothetical protein
LKAETPILASNTTKPTSDKISNDNKKTGPNNSTTAAIAAK